MNSKQYHKGGTASGGSPDPRAGTAGQTNGKANTRAKANQPGGGPHGQPRGSTAYKKPRFGTAGQDKSGG